MAIKDHYKNLILNHGTFAFMEINVNELYYYRNSIHLVFSKLVDLYENLIRHLMTKKVMNNPLLKDSFNKRWLINRSVISVEHRYSAINWTLCSEISQKFQTYKEIQYFYRFLKYHSLLPTEAIMVDEKEEGDEREERGEEGEDNEEKGKTLFEDINFDEIKFEEKPKILKGTAEEIYCYKLRSPCSYFLDALGDEQNQTTKVNSFYNLFANNPKSSSLEKLEKNMNNCMAIQNEFVL